MSWICDTCGGIGEVMDMKCYGDEPRLEMSECPDCTHGMIRDYYKLMKFLFKLKIAREKMYEFF